MKGKQTTLSILAVLLIFSMLLSACGGGAVVEPTQAPAAAPTQAPAAAAPTEAPKAAEATAPTEAPAAPAPVAPEPPAAVAPPQPAAPEAPPAPVAPAQAAPVQAVRVSGQLADRQVECREGRVVEPTEPLEGLAEDLLLEAALRGHGHVLEVAAAAAIRVGPRAGGSHAVG